MTPLDPVSAAIRATMSTPPVNLPASVPIYESAAWSFRDLDELEAVLAGAQPGVFYGSFGVPNHDALEELCSGLEHAEASVATNGGMTAIFGALFTHLRPGDRLVASYNLFGPTLRLLTELRRYDMQLALVDGCDLDAVEGALEEPTRVLLVETASNPRLRVADIPALALLAHDAGALLFVDNTFASPLVCRPLEHGADLVLESLTKFVVGHYDALAGLVSGCAELVEPVRANAFLTGWLVGPFEAWLALRGAQTLDIRVRQASRNAAALADWLSDRSEVLAVHYPGRPDHPDHHVARRIFWPEAAGALLAFEIGGGRAEINRMLQAFEQIRLVTSLGGMATTVNHPVSTSHRDIDDEARERSGIHPGLVRLAVGIEGLDALQADLARGLSATRSVSRQRRRGSRPAGAGPERRDGPR